MKPSMWTSFLYDETPEAAVEILTSAGFKHAELSDEHAKVLLSRPDAMAKAAEFASFASSKGMKFTQGHLSLSADISDPDEIRRKATIEQLKKELSLFRILGITTAVLHCGGRVASEQGIEREMIDKIRTVSLHELCAHIAGTGMKIALENIPSTQPFADDLLKVIEAAGAPEELGICFDTGHLNMVGGDPEEFISKAKNKLIALHIADNLGQKDDHMLPCGRGTVAWAKVIGKLKAIGYKGIFNYEVPGERHHPLPILRLKLEYSRILAETMISTYPSIY